MNSKTSQQQEQRRAMMLGGPISRVIPIAIYKTHKTKKTRQLFEQSLLSGEEEVYAVQ